MTSEQQLGCEGGPLNSRHLARVPFQFQMSEFIILNSLSSSNCRPEYYSDDFKSLEFLCYLFLLQCFCTLQ